MVVSSNDDFLWSLVLLSMDLIPVILTAVQKSKLHHSSKMWEMFLLNDHCNAAIDSVHITSISLAIHILDLALELRNSDTLLFCCPNVICITEATRAKNDAYT